MVVREAVIKVRTEQQRAKLEAPDVGPAEKAFQREAAAADKATQATESATKATGEHSRSLVRFHQRIAAALAESTAATRAQTSAAKDAGPAADAWAAGMAKVNAAYADSASWRVGLARLTQQQQEATHAAREHSSEVTLSTDKIAHDFDRATISVTRDFDRLVGGSLRVARGIAFMSASSEEDLRKMIRTLALAEGAVSALGGSARVLRGLTRLLGGPLALAVTGVTAALAVGGVAAWRAWGGAAEGEARRAIAALDDVRFAHRDADRERQRAEADAERRFLKTDKAVGDSLRKEMEGLGTEEAGLRATIAGRQDAINRDITREPTTRFGTGTAEVIAANARASRVVDPELRADRDRALKASKEDTEELLAIARRRRELEDQLFEQAQTRLRQEHELERQQAEQFNVHGMPGHTDALRAEQEAEIDRQNERRDQVVLRQSELIEKLLAKVEEFDRIMRQLNIE